MTKLNTQFSNMATMYILHTHLNNLVLTFSRAELEAAIVLQVAKRSTKNSHIARVLNNLNLTYGHSSVIEAASVMGLCTLDKTA